MKDLAQVFAPGLSVIVKKWTYAHNSTPVFLLYLIKNMQESQLSLWNLLIVLPKSCHKLDHER